MAIPREKASQVKKFKYFFAHFMRLDFKQITFMIQ